MVRGLSVIFQPFLINLHTMASASPSHALRTFRTHHPFEGKVNTRRRRRLKDVARTLPRAPGIYFFYGYQDRLLYIGKAKCLRERVRSYFAETKHARPPKLRRLLAEIEYMQWDQCGSELEALLLERRLIAERRPLLNRQHKRFDVYPYLLLSDEAFPRLTLTRAEPAKDEAEPTESDLPEAWDEADEAEWQLDGSLAQAALPLRNALRAHSNLPLETPPRLGELPGLYLGPFTTPRIAFWTLEAVRALFPLRTCEGEIVPDENARGCIYGEMKRCAAPCVGETSREEYARLCANLIALLQTGNSPQLDALRARMTALADQWRYEDAARLKQQLTAIELVATRLRRLERMRAENNVVIVQPAMQDTSNAGGQSVFSYFLVRGGIVRQHLTLASSAGAVLKSAIRELYSGSLPGADFTAKAELDEMMVLDRWLAVHGQETCCAWMNDRVGRQWPSNAARQLISWTQQAA